MVDIEQLEGKTEAEVMEIINAMPETKARNALTILFQSMTKTLAEELIAAVADKKWIDAAAIATTLTAVKNLNIHSLPISLAEKVASA